MCLYEIANLKNKSMIKVYVAGHTGMVGSSIVRNLRKTKISKLLKLKESNLTY